VIACVISKALHLLSENVEMGCRLGEYSLDGVLYVYERCVVWNGDNRFGLFENRVLKEIFGPVKG
jgi:hypothetical protein